MMSSLPQQPLVPMQIHQSIQQPSEYEILSLAKTQHGVRLLQRHLDSGDPATIKSVLLALDPSDDSCVLAAISSLHLHRLSQI